MAKSVRSKKQARSEKSALKKLFELGIIRKPDLRKSASKAQRDKIKKFADIIAAKPAPKSAQKTARKGEKLFKTKSGEIIGVRKIGGKVAKTRHRKVQKGSDIKPPEKKRRIQYALPFIRGRDKSGKAILEWKRFPDFNTLAAFMKQYETYKDWADYVVEDDFGGKVGRFVDDDETGDERDWASVSKSASERLRKKLEARMQRRAKEWRAAARGKSSTRNLISKGGAGRKRMSKKRGR